MQAGGAVSLGVAGASAPETHQNAPPALSTRSRRAAASGDKVDHYHGTAHANGIGLQAVTRPVELMTGAVQANALTALHAAAAWCAHDLGCRHSCTCGCLDCSAVGITNIVETHLFQHS